MIFATSSAQPSGNSRIHTLQAGDSSAGYEREQPIAITTRSLRPLSAFSNTPALLARIQSFHQHCAALGIAELIQFLPSHDNPQIWTIVIDHYCHFLCLMDLYPDRALVPTPMLDQVWHAHILDTSRYRRDCLALFGRFIDHQPFREHTSQPGIAATPYASTPYTDTVQLFRHHFQIDLVCDDMAIGPHNSTQASSAAWQFGACGRGVSPFNLPDSGSSDLH
jgi:hypothetical protein